MNPIETILAILILVMNLVTFVLYYADKRKAEKGQWRIKESTLLIATTLAGSLGAFLAMRIFHHKTHKAPFFWLVPLMLAVHIAIIIFRLFS